MTKRKDQLRAMFENQPLADAKPREADGQGADAPGPEAPKRATSGAVKAMGLALDSLSREAAEARHLREAVESGDVIVRLDPARIDASIISDRLDGGMEGDAAFDALKASMAEAGQQVPVLVRPHPDAAKAADGWYQAAYGHRRIRAARDLGIRVQAIVRTLDDTALLVAQGKENTERRDLSYIERVMFARSILGAGHSRETAQTALGVDKTEMSRMVQVGDSVPAHIIHAIGAAPKVGRPRWLALGGLLNREAAVVIANDVIASDAFRAARSDSRFVMLHDRLARRKKAAPAGTKSIKDGQGRVLATLSAGGASTRLEMSGGNHAAFAAFVAEHLPALAAQFAAGASKAQS